MIAAGGKFMMTPKRDYFFPIVDDNSDVTHSPDPTSKSFPFGSQVHQPIPRPHLDSIFHDSMREDLSFFCILVVYCSWKQWGILHTDPFLSGVLITHLFAQMNSKYFHIKFSV